MKFQIKLMNLNRTVLFESTKIYKDMNEYYWWLRIKGEIVGFVTKCAICQQIMI